MRKHFKHRENLWIKVLKNRKKYSKSTWEIGKIMKEVLYWSMKNRAIFKKEAGKSLEMNVFKESTPKTGKKYLKITSEIGKNYS